MKVALDPDADTVGLVDANREMTVRDLIRHTSGLPGATIYMAHKTALGDIYRAAGLDRLFDCDLQEMIERLGSVPLLYQPGMKWHYSIAADVLGRLIEVVSNERFDTFLSEWIFQPLKMLDTDFYVPPDKVNRLSQMYVDYPNNGLRVVDAPEGGTGNISATAFLERPKFLSAGGGLVSTAADFTRFCLMLTEKGELEGKCLLQPAFVDEMTRNQLPNDLVPLDKTPMERYDGLEFGLGVSVRAYRTDWVPASQAGEYGWIGGTSTEFWVSPKDDGLVSIVLTQKMPFSDLSQTIKPLVYAAIEKGR